jgi:uncharacterized membrane protein SirB2
VLAFYAQIKTIHVAAVLLSGALFLARGLLVLAGRSRIGMSAPVRYASYGIDTVLLTAALMLVSILPAATFANRWLSLKLALLIVYVVLGALALRRAATPQGRGICFLAALTVYATMIGIARTHHPMGWLRAWAG